MIHPMCILKFIYRSATVGAWVSGHDYVTSKDKTPKNVHVLECEKCGHVSVVWSWDSLEHHK